MSLHYSEFISDVPVFRPTAAEFADFAAYVGSIEASAIPYGVFKVRSPLAVFVLLLTRFFMHQVIPPAGWVPRASGYDDVIASLRIKDPVKQEFSGKGGIFTQINWLQRSMPLSSFKTMANSPDYATPSPEQDPRQKRESAEHASTSAMTSAQRYGFLEKKYWANVFSRQPVYGADMECSLMDEGLEAWNLRHLGTMLEKIPTKIPGINSPYLYFGTHRTSRRRKVFVPRQQR